MTVSSSPRAATAAQMENILRFWRDVEIFNIPTAPSDRDNDKSTKVSLLKPGEPLPWEPDFQKRLKRGPDEVWTHNVYLGVADLEVLAQMILAEVFPTSQPPAMLSEGERNRLQGRGWLVGFVLDHEGRPVSSSYIPASFAYGVKRLKCHLGLDGLGEDLSKAPGDFNLRRHCPIPDPEEPPPPPPPPMDWESLSEEHGIAVSLLGETGSGMEILAIIKSKKRKKPKDGGEIPRSDIDFLNSFYLNDLDRLISSRMEGIGFGKALQTYLGPETETKVDLLIDDREMERRIDPVILPAGRWPSNPVHHLHLAQQAAVSTILKELSDDRGLIAVNGPPGTGKTTLLQDVIAGVVTRRALAIANLSRPRDVFERERVKIGAKEMSVLRRDICHQTGIVVTSNNNSAVQNISLELPARGKIHKSFGNPTYFEVVSDQLFQSAKKTEGSWGLVAGVLGSARRRNAFAKALFRDEKEMKAKQDGVGEEDDASPDLALREEEPGNQQGKKPDTLKQILEADCSESEQWKRNWERSKAELLRLISEFQGIKTTLERVRNEVAQLRTLRSELEKTEDLIRIAEANLLQVQSSHRESCDLARTRMEEAQSFLEATKETNRRYAILAENARSLAEQENRSDPPSLWETLLRRLLGIETKCYVAWAARCRKAMMIFQSANEDYVLSVEAVEGAHKTWDLAKKNATRVEAEQQKSVTEAENLVGRHVADMGKISDKIESLEQGQAELKAAGLQIPDDAFWGGSPEDKHRASPWLSVELDELRSRIFLEAVRLHECTIRSCPKDFLALLRLVRKMLLGGGNEPLDAEARDRLWNTLFFVVPVVSTTLASFDRLFQGMGQESLGWLLVDEAGQATPQSVVGAIWRARRAVIVGDPKQVEPVVTVPGALVKALRECYTGVGPEWSPSTESAQTLSDRVTQMGAWIGKSTGDESQATWTGMPLRAHRRCDAPMFDVANAIAYGGQMVQANTGDNPRPLRNDPGPSRWIDVRAETSDGQVVGEELSALSNELEKLRERWPVVPENETGKPAKVYVISPFKKVAQACDEAVKVLGLDEVPFEVECGTVHRFQGKEAEIVFLVLGSAPGDKDSGSRNWASKEPNLLNVALTRAKNRIYVIGNEADWGACRGFEFLAEALNTHAALPAVGP